MKSLIALAAAVTLTAGAAHAGVVAPSKIYEFSGNLNEQNGGATATTTWGTTYQGSGETQGLKYARNDGPTILAPFKNPGIYSLEMYFSMDKVGGWQRIVDFSRHEAGIYAMSDSILFYGYNGTGADINFAPNQMLHMVFTRDSAGHFRAYAGGVEIFNVSDAFYGHAVFGDQMQLFNDRPGGSEAGTGFLDFARLYDRVLTQDEITQLYAGGTPLRAFDSISAVPEPGTWALMIGGFGLTGAALRRRRSLAAVAHA